MKYTPNPTEPHDPEICGRPLGFDFDTVDTDALIVADAYYGIWSVNTRTLRKTQLIAADQQLPGEGPAARPALFFNSIAVARNGDIYFTDSSSDFNLINGLQTFFTNPSGRLFRYERATRRTHLLADRLHFANGLVLSPDESFVVVAETAASRLRRVHLSGPRRGTNDVFVDGLPGAPDNLSADREGIWVPMVLTTDPEVPLELWKSAGAAPLVRTFLLRLIAGLRQPLVWLQQVLPNTYAKLALNYLGSFDMIAGLVPKRSTLLRVDWSGKVVASLSGRDGSVSMVAHVLEHDGKLWLGSFKNNYIGRVSVPKGLKRGDAALGGEPRVVVTAKPMDATKTTTTTTTPKPVTVTTPSQPKSTKTATTTTTPKTKPSTTTTTTTTPKPTKKTTTTTTTPTPTTAAPTVAPKPTTTTTTPKPAAATKPTVKKPVASAKLGAASAVPPPPPPPTPQQQPPQPAAVDRNVPESQPIEERHEEPTRPPPPPKMKVIKRGGEQGEF